MEQLLVIMPAFITYIARNPNANIGSYVKKNTVRKSKLHQVGTPRASVVLFTATMWNSI